MNRIVQGDFQRPSQVVADYPLEPYRYLYLYEPLGGRLPAPAAHPALTPDGARA